MSKHSHSNDNQQEEEDDAKSDSSVSLSHSDDDDDKLEQKEKIFIEFMTYSNEYIKLRHQMHVNLARGYLNLARGRHSSAGKLRRNKNIFNKEMTASLFVEQTKNGSFMVYKHPRNKTKNVKQKESTLRKRGTSDKNKNNEDDKKEQDSNEPKIVDPITWFGAMVPKAMCIAQNDFKKSLNLLVEMANVTQRLDVLNEKWDKLK